MLRWLANGFGKRLDRKSAVFVVQAYRTAIQHFLAAASQERPSASTVAGFEAELGKMVLLGLAGNSQLAITPTQQFALSRLMQDDDELIWDSSDEGLTNTIAAWVYVSSSRFHDALHEFQRTLSSFRVADAPFFSEFKADRERLFALLREKQLEDRKAGIRAEAEELGMSREYEPTVGVTTFRISYVRNGNPYFHDIDASSAGEAKDKFLLHSEGIPREHLHASPVG